MKKKKKKISGHSGIIKSLNFHFDENGGNSSDDETNIALEGEIHKEERRKIEPKFVRDSGGGISEDSEDIMIVTDEED